MIDGRKFSRLGRLVTGDGLGCGDLQDDGNFPLARAFGLTNQPRRAAVSVPSNLAEGQGRNTTSDFLRYLSIARGSLQEVQTQLEISYRVGYLDEITTREILDSTDEMARLLDVLYRSLTIY